MAIKISNNKGEVITERCICGNIFAYHNKGVSKKTGKPYENYKCNCGNIKWINLDETPETIAEAEYIDSIFDEASHNKQT